MGDYVQVTELGAYFDEARIIDLADGDSATETLTTLALSTQAVLEAQINNAEVETAGYLQGRFDLPVSPVPGRLKLAVGEITIYRLLDRKPEMWGGLGRNPKTVQYDAQVDWLEGVKESDLFVGSDQVESATTDVLSTVDNTTDGRVFAGGGLSDF